MIKGSKLTEKQVRHIAKLASLYLSGEENKKFQKQLGEILDYVGSLNRLVTKPIEPISQVTGLKNVFKEDLEGKSLSPKEALSNAKEAYKSYFKTKKIFD